MTRNQMKTLTSIYPFIEEYTCAKENKYGTFYTIDENTNEKTRSLMRRTSTSNAICITISDDSEYPEKLYAMKHAIPTQIRVIIEEDGSFIVEGIVSFVKKIDNKYFSVWNNSFKVWLRNDEVGRIKDILEKIEEEPFEGYLIIDNFIGYNMEKKSYATGNDSEWQKSLKSDIADAAFGDDGGTDATQKFEIPEELLVTEEKK